MGRNNRIKLQNIFFSKYFIVLISVITLFLSDCKAQDDCLNFSDLSSDSVTLITGYHSTILVCSAQSDTDWFYTIDDSSLYDANTANMLRTVPEGENYSVRVGRYSKYDEYLTKLVNYRYFVDTNQNDYLIIRYAIAGQESFGGQQDFHIRFYDENEAEIKYMHFSKYLKSSEEWQQSTSDNTFWWCDWDSLYYDLTPFHNQHINFSLMVNTNPYLSGYFYYTISCGTKNRPYAQWEYEIDTCRSVAVFKDKSFITNDGINPAESNRYIDSVKWVTQDGKIYYGEEFELRIDENKDYSLTMIVHMSESDLTDTLYIEIPVDFNLSVSVDGRDSLCLGDTLSLYAQTGLDDILFKWNNGMEGKHIVVTPSVDDTVWSVTAYINDTCQGTVYKDIEVIPPQYDTVKADICEGEYFVFDSQQYSQSGLYTNEYKNQIGCDSIRTLDLTVWQPYSDTITAQYCDSGYYDNGFSAEESGFYTQKLQSVYGCDSIVNLDFIKFDVFKDSLQLQIYKGMTYSDNNFEETQKGVYTQVYTDVNGCDSIYILDLDILEFRFPTAVTPNGDGINEFFEIKGIIGQTLFDDIVLQIYNRSGRMIFRQEKFENNANFWHPDSVNAPTGTYFYRFVAKGRLTTVDFTGSVEVLR